MCVRYLQGLAWVLLVVERSSAQKVEVNESYCNSAQLTLDNDITYISVSFGTLGILASTLVILVLVGYSRDRRLLQDRLLLAAFVCNWIYSLGNAMPRIFDTHGYQCGEAVEGIEYYSWTIGLVILGKISTVCYEVFIIGASIMVLKSGKQIRIYVESLCHAICIVTALIAASIMTSTSLRIGHELAEFAADSNNQTEIVEFVQERQQDLKNLFQNLLIVGSSFLGLGLILWLYQRILLYMLLKEWDNLQKTTIDTMDRDLWDTSRSDVQSMRATKMRLLMLTRQGYLDIAQPLERYVVIFFLFAPATFVLATDYCANASGVRCQLLDGSVLAARSLACAIAFFFDRERRVELYNYRLLFKKLVLRIGNHPRYRINFSRINSEREYDPSERIMHPEESVRNVNADGSSTDPL